MGYRTPNIDRIANAGMIFTDSRLYPSLAGPVFASMALCLALTL